MNSFRVGIILDLTMPKYIYVNSVDEAVAAIKAANAAIDLMSQKYELGRQPSIINLETYNPTSNEWEFWFDEHGRDIHEYMQTLD